MSSMRDHFGEIRRCSVSKKGVDGCITFPQLIIASYLVHHTPSVRYHRRFFASMVNHAIQARGTRDH